MVRFRNKQELFEDKLFRETEDGARCPWVRRDCQGAYCGKDLQEGKPISQYRRMACDSTSLQVVCLDKEKYPKCIYFQGESFPV